jgi:uncharacterized protein
MTAALAFCVVIVAAFAWAITFPQLSGRVVDEADILDLQTEALLEQKLAELESKTTNQLVVVTLKSLQGTSIEDYGYQLGRHWGIGQKGVNNGVLLIVAPQERRVRIEVGYGLEGVLTDAVTRLIIENSIFPRFRANDHSGGIARGVDDIIAVLSGSADEYKQRAAQRRDAAPEGIDIGNVFLFIIIVLVVWSMIRNSGLMPRRRGLWGAGPIAFPTGGGWSGRSSGGGGGGGFSGGGGSFGGGGSSGSW